MHLVAYLATQRRSRSANLLESAEGGGSLDATHGRAAITLNTLIGTTEPRFGSSS
jgi:hypothetical protein